MNKTLLFITLLSFFAFTQAVLTFNNVDLYLTNPNQTIEILGASSSDSLGGTVRNTGDINADGIDDFILGVTTLSPLEAGSAYIIYGSRNGFPQLDLQNFTQSQGFRVFGASAGDNFGVAVNGAGDVNGDGIADMIVGAWDASPLGRQKAGITYVIFGRAGGLNDTDVANLTSAQGFRVLGANDSDYLGGSVAGAGDVNGDGIADIVIGAQSASPLGRFSAGEAYVIYGSRNVSDVDLANLTSSQGFKILGASFRANLGSSVNRAGDVNGDNIDDIIVSNGLVSENRRIAYVIFGSQNGSSDIDLADFNSTRGVKISAAGKQYSFAFVGSAAGDVNGDGIDDVILGNDDANPFNRTNAGIAYVIFGSANGLSDIDLDNITNTQGFRVFGAYVSDALGGDVSAVGDVNGDGIDDVIIGAHTGVRKFRKDAGAAYVIFGSASQRGDIDLHYLNNTQGFQVMGAHIGDSFGMSVSGAGDVDGDGINDLLVGANNASPLMRYHAGTVYVLLTSRLAQGEAENIIVS